MDAQNYEALKLRNQLCFPLYACSREVIKQYKPFLQRLDLTYTQYITMMLLWEHGSMTAKKLGEALFLDSGTLTPLLKKLEAKGLLSRTRLTADERSLLVSITPAGEELKRRAVTVPEQIGQCVHLEPEEAMTLYGLLYKILGQLED